MAQNITNHQLAKALDQTSQRLEGVEIKLGQLDEKLDEEIRPIRDYIIGQEAVAKAQESGTRSSSSVSVPTELLKILGLALAIAAAALGVKQIS